ncbi:MAG: hypothetical protein ABIR32_15095 [Ilumatobacteraceae bacterium]
MSSGRSLRLVCIDRADDHDDHHDDAHGDDDDDDHDDDDIRSMDARNGPTPLSFLDRSPPAWADIETITIPAGGHRPYNEQGWRRAMVVVERGAVSLECARGGRRTFGAGSVLWTVGLDLVSLHNGGETPAVLSVVQRRSRQND